MKHTSQSLIPLLIKDGSSDQYNSWPPFTLVSND